MSYVMVTVAAGDWSDPASPASNATGLQNVFF
jgi:hypothetical protein